MSENLVKSFQNCKNGPTTTSSFEIRNAGSHESDNADNKNKMCLLESVGFLNNYFFATLLHEQLNQNVLINTA